MEEGGTNQQTDRRTDGQMDRNFPPPHVLQDFIPFGAAAQKFLISPLTTSNTTAGLHSAAKSQLKAKNSLSLLQPLQTPQLALVRALRD